MATLCVSKKTALQPEGLRLSPRWQVLESFHLAEVSLSKTRMPNQLQKPWNSSLTFWGLWLINKKIFPVELKVVWHIRDAMMDWLPDYILYI